MRVSKVSSISSGKALLDLIGSVSRSNGRSISAELRTRFIEWGLRNLIIVTENDIVGIPDKQLIDGMTYDPEIHGTERIEIPLHLSEAENLFIEVLSQ